MLSFFSSVECWRINALLVFLPSGKKNQIHVCCVDSLFIMFAFFLSLFLSCVFVLYVANCYVSTMRKIKINIDWNYCWYFFPFSGCCLRRWTINELRFVKFPVVANRNSGDGSFGRPLDFLSQCCSMWCDECAGDSRYDDKHFAKSVRDDTQGLCNMSICNWYQIKNLLYVMP